MNSKLPSPEKIISKEIFSKEVEEFRLKTKCAILQAIIEVAEKKGLEIETLNRLLTAELKDKLKAEAEELNLLEKTAKLPI